MPIPPRQRLARVLPHLLVGRGVEPVRFGQLDAHALGGGTADGGTHEHVEHAVERGQCHVVSWRVNLYEELERWFVVTELAEKIVGFSREGMLGVEIEGPTADFTTVPKRVAHASERISVPVIFRHKTQVDTRLLFFTGSIFNGSIFNGSI